MTLFKISRGIEAKLPATITDGCVYFCTDTGNFYIDYSDELFNKEDLIDNANRNTFINIDGIEYYRYHCSAKSFEWNNPLPVVGSVTITFRVVNQYSTGNMTRLIAYYDDGTYDYIWPSDGVVGTFTTNAKKTFVKLTGNYDIENWALLDMSVMSIAGAKRSKISKNITIKTWTEEDLNTTRSFTISTVGTFNFENGMTWEEWIEDSNYNTIDIYKSEYGDYIVYGEHSILYNSKEVNYTDLIIADATYTISSTASEPV